MQTCACAHHARVRQMYVRWWFCSQTHSLFSLSSLLASPPVLPLSFPRRIGLPEVLLLTEAKKIEIYGQKNQLYIRRNATDISSELQVLVAGLDLVVFLVGFQSVQPFLYSSSKWAPGSTPSHGSQKNWNLWTKKSTLHKAKCNGYFIGITGFGRRTLFGWFFGLFFIPARFPFHSWFYSSSNCVRTYVQTIFSALPTFWRRNRTYVRT